MTRNATSSTHEQPNLPPMRSRMIYRMALTNHYKQSPCAELPQTIILQPRDGSNPTEDMMNEAGIYLMYVLAENGLAHQSVFCDPHEKSIYINFGGDQEAMDKAESHLSGILRAGHSPSASA